MLRTYAHVARPPAFRAYTLSAALTYAGLFAFLSGSSFVFINVLGETPTRFAFACSTMVVGYLFGTVVCRRRLVIHGIHPVLVATRLMRAHEIGSAHG